MVLKQRKNHSKSLPATCPLMECMQLIEGAWAANIIWYLRAGPRRFNELRADIPPISAKVLSTRLNELQQRSLVLRRVCDTSPPSVEYELTDIGRALVPALDAIVEVGQKIKQKKMEVERAQADAKTDDG